MNILKKNKLAGCVKVLLFKGYASDFLLDMVSLRDESLNSKKY